MVARAGADAVPPLPPPAGLRPFLRLAWLPPRALVPIKRVLDRDEEFRARVASVATEEAVGHAGVLFLQRPEGWESELADLLGAAAAASDAVQDEREERSARRRLAGAQEARLRAERELMGTRSQLEEVGSRLADEREARRQATERAEEAEVRAADVLSERDELRRQLDLAAAAEAERRREVEALRLELDEARSRLSNVTVDAGVLSAVADAAHAAADLASSLDAVYSALGSPADDGPGPAAMTAPATPSVPAPGGLRRTRGRRRQPERLPPGIYDDSEEAAEFLVRRPGAVLLVDGYNATLSASPWTGLDLQEQRRRLVDALGGLAARSGAEVEVVFDGADESPVPQPAVGGRRPVRVSFSSAGEEADDVIIRRSANLPAARVVVVASSDRRVGEGARKSGANVISASQLMSLIRIGRDRG